MLRSRLAGTLITPGGTDCTTGVDAYRSTIQQRLDVVVHRLRCDREGNR